MSGFSYFKLKISSKIRLINAKTHSVPNNLERIMPTLVLTLVYKNLLIFKASKLAEIAQEYFPGLKLLKNELSVFNELADGRLSSLS